MPRFAANITMMFTEHALLDRFAAAADAGFQAVELLAPYEQPADEIARCAAAAGVAVSLFNLPPGDWAAGERGVTGLPGREAEFREGVATAIRYAKTLGTTCLHAMAGVLPASGDKAACLSTLVDNLKYVAAETAKEDITLFLEAINTRDIPGFLVNTQAESHQLCKAVGATNLKMQMDLYHMQIMEGDLEMTLRHYAGECGHIQIAGCPGRHEPDTGEIRYEHLFRVIDELGYAGWVGCEYKPAGRTVDGLGWLQRTVNSLGMEKI